MRRRKIPTWVGVAAACLLLHAGCESQSAPEIPSDDVQERVLQVAGHPVRVEVRRTVKGRARGLMYRERLPDDRGMLFVYPDARPLSFWMRNTRIPLSIAFIDASGRISNIEHMMPETERSHRSTEPVPFALEVNQGWFELRNIGPGAQVTGLDGLQDGAEPAPGPP